MLKETVSLQNLLAEEAPIRWLFCGDSITHGVRHTWGFRDYTQHFAERVRGEMGRCRDIVVNSAISGHTTRHVLEDFEWRVGQFRPGVVFLMVGMNDCAQSRGIGIGEFAANLEKICRLVRDGDGGAVVLQTSPPILKGTAPDREDSFPAYMNVVRGVAEAEGLELVDHEAHWRLHADKHFFWMSDSYHPGMHGHLAMARHLFEVLGIHDPHSPTGRLFLP